MLSQGQQSAYSFSTALGTINGYQRPSNYSIAALPQSTDEPQLPYHSNQEVNAQQMRLRN